MATVGTGNQVHKKTGSLHKIMCKPPLGLEREAETIMTWKTDG